jgi:hypothetical protein
MLGGRELTDLETGCQPTGSPPLPRMQIFRNLLYLGLFLGVSMVALEPVQVSGEVNRRVRKGYCKSTPHFILHPWQFVTVRSKISFIPV